MDFDKCHLCRSQNPPYERDAATFDLRSHSVKGRFSSTITVGLTTFEGLHGETRTLRKWSRSGEIYLPKITMV